MTSSSQTGPRLRLRLLISLAVGVSVAVVAILAVRQVYGGEMGSLPTILQFLSTEKEARGAILTCLACGGLAALVTRITLRGPDVGRGGILELIVKLALVTGVSLVLAFVLSVMQIPCGHRRRMTSSSQTGLRLLLRLLISVGVGVLVTVVAIVAAWRAHGARIPLLTEEAHFTGEQMREIAREISKYQRRTGRLPATRRELFAATEPDADSSWRWEDGWNHRLIYTVEGDEYAFTSLGRDGKPGGTGLDSDLVVHMSRDMPPPVVTPPLTQFLHDMRTSGIILACLWSKLLAALAALVTIRAPDPTARGILALALKLLLVTLPAIGLAMLLSVFELPTRGGH